MFNVTRPFNVPADLAKKQYNTNDVVKALKLMFHEKCYLCERDNIHDVEVEHFIPHEGDETLKYDWHNLNYSCSRCNSIKSNKHKNLLDCTDDNTDVGALIMCMMPSAPSLDVLVKATSSSPCDKTLNTVALLHDCYNSENTALRGISRESLMEQIWDHYTELLFARSVLRKKNSGTSRKKEAEETISEMLKVSYPFSIFWRYYYLKDKFLLENYSHLKIGF